MPTNPSELTSEFAAARHALLGTRHMVSAGHYLAAQAGFQILEAGGNAVDAGVAAGLAIGVVQSEFVNIAGVAPIIIHLAETSETVTIDGLGVWPKAATLEFFEREHSGKVRAASTGWWCRRHRTPGSRRSCATAP